MNPLKVYLCDLTHDTIIPVSDTIPVNIGYIGAYSDKVHGKEIALDLFKYPGEAIAAIKANPPDVIGLSNYSWNSRLAERIARLAKQENPDAITVQGGPNFPHDREQQLEFLRNRPATDFYVELEGEVSFSNLIARVLEARDGANRVFDGPVDGCLFIHPETRDDPMPKLVAGMAPARIRDLDDIPSPYLNGMMDKFFDGRLAPFLETNRGCPFKCSFCHTGSDYFRKMNMFSLERISRELEYIAKRAEGLDITGLTIADTNFGMFPRDREICEELLRVKQSYGWPLNIGATTGKNNKERVIDITGILGDAFSVNMSVQSMDLTVLENINRSNIKLDSYMDINQHLRDQGRSTKGEMILGLPGETKSSFLGGIEEIVSTDVSMLCIYTLMLLHGTKFKDPEYLREFAYQTRFRIVPLNFGEYDGEKIFDYEEVGVASKDMSFDDYLYLRRFSLLVESIYNNRPFEGFFRYAQTLGVTNFEFLNRVSEQIEFAPDGVKEIIDGFMAETNSELWPTEEAMIAHYQDDEAFENLKDGKVGGNLIYKYKSMSLAYAMPDWISFLSRQLIELAKEMPGHAHRLPEIEVEVAALAEYGSKKIWKFLDNEFGDTPTSMDSDYDFIAWHKSPIGTRLSEYAVKHPIRYLFDFTEEQKRSRRDAFRRFGTDFNGLSKIVTRLAIQTLFRKVSVMDAPPGRQVSAA